MQRQEEQYIGLLYEVIVRTVRSGWLSDPDGWDSLLINRRQPETCRMMRLHGEHRICLHRFSPCNHDEAFPHPHPWPGAFMVLKGSYRLMLGRSSTTDTVPEAMVGPIILKAGTCYAMTDPLQWHVVHPLEVCYTIMVNGGRYGDDVRHVKAPTTQGKDLEPLSQEQKKVMLADISGYLMNPAITGHAYDYMVEKAINATNA